MGFELPVGRTFGAEEATVNRQQSLQAWRLRCLDSWAAVVVPMWGRSQDCWSAVEIRSLLVNLPSEMESNPMAV